LGSYVGACGRYIYCMLLFIQHHPGLCARRLPHVFYCRVVHGHLRAVPSCAVIGGKLYSECAYNNPYPEKNIMGIVYRPCEKFKDVNVYIRSIVYSPADEADDKTGGTLGGGFDSENMHNEKRNNE